MRKVFLVLLSALVLTGCEASTPSPVIASSTLPTATTRTAAPTGSPVLSPTPSIAYSPMADPVETPEITPDEEIPELNWDEATPEPIPTFPLATIADLERGPGRPVGTVATTDGKYIYYDRLYSASFDPKSGVKDSSRIYRFDPKTKKSQVIRIIPGDSNILMQIFTDRNGNLYYVLVDYVNSSQDNFLYRYHPTGDVLLATNVNEVVRVDGNFIYYYLETYGASDRLMACNLKNGSIVEVKNKSNIILWKAGENQISWSYKNKQCKINIRNSYSGVTRSINLPASSFHFDNNSAFEAADMKGYVVGNDLVLLVKSILKQNSTTIYKINITRKKVVSKKTIIGEVNLHRAISMYKDKIYFHSWIQKEYTDENQKIQAYNIKDGKIQIIKRIPDGGFEDGMVL